MTLKGIFQDETFAAPGSDAEEVEEGAAHLVFNDVFFQQREHKVGKMSFQVTQY